MTHPILDKSLHPWAEKLEQRAIHLARDTMHHRKIDSSHYMGSLALAESYEVPARNLKRVMELDPQVVLPIIRESQRSDSPQAMAMEYFTEEANRMMTIAGLQASHRHRTQARDGIVQIIQNDFIVGILLSRSEVVETVLVRAGVEIQTIFLRLGITPAPATMDLMVNG